MSNSKTAVLLSKRETATQLTNDLKNRTRIDLFKKANLATQLYKYGHKDVGKVTHLDSGCLTDRTVC